MKNISANAAVIATVSARCKYVYLEIFLKTWYAPFLLNYFMKCISTFNEMMFPGPLPSRSDLHQNANLQRDTEIKALISLALYKVYCVDLIAKLKQFSQHNVYFCNKLKL